MKNKVARCQSNRRAMVRRRTYIVMAVTTAMMILGPAVAVLGADTPSFDETRWEVVATYRDTHVVPDPFTGEDLVLEGTRVILRPVDGGHSTAAASSAMAGSCTSSGWQGDPYVNVGYGDAYAMAHAYWSVSSGCTSGVSWNQSLWKKNIFGAWGFPLDTDSGYAPVGGHDYTTVSEVCDNSNIKDWRSSWSQSPTYSNTVSLSCDT